MKRYLGRRETMTVQDWLKLGWTLEDAERLALESPQLQARVYVQSIGADGQVLDERPLTHHVKHSPSGFEWGYHGSGCSETARSVIVDHLGGLDALPENAFGERVVPCYQSFKRQFIAVAPDEGFVITDVEIAAFLALEEAQEALKEEGS